MKKLNPYIGITDFTDFSQVQAMLKVFKAHLPEGSDRVLHVGVMMSHKSLHGIPTEFQGAFARKEKVASIFAPSDAYKCLHFADYGVHEEPFMTVGNLIMALSLAGPYVDAIQLDMVWPDPGQIAQAAYHSKKNVEVILQVGTKALAQVGDDPKMLVRALESYEGVIHRVLLDKSAGRGVGMDAEELIILASAIRERFPLLGLTFAGGLGPTSVDLVGRIPQVFPDASYDAQSKLRPTGSALDPIHWGMGADYLVKAIKRVT